MSLIGRTTLLTVFVSIAMQVPAAENGTTADKSLERRVVDLEKRVSELETIRNGTPSKASGIPNSGNWKDLQNWRQLRTGMSYDEVRALLGEPENIEGGQIAQWYWGGRKSRVVFMSDKLYQWSEPR
jgi:hypothetical protein